MNIRVVDIDGVVLPIGAMAGVIVDDVVRDVGMPERNSTPWPHLDLITSRVSAAAVTDLQRLATGSQCRFVLISTWRRVFPEGSSANLVLF